MKTEARFTFDAILDLKSAVQETEDGDLIIEGFVSDYDPDRDDEMFEPGALDDGLKAFMGSNPILIYNHRFGPGNALALGQVQEVGKRDNPATGKEGIWFRARVDKPEPMTEAADVFTKIKRGTLRGISFGGKFYRRFVNGRTKIWKADVMEFSVTPVPANPRALASVAVKAFGEDPDGLDLDTLNEIADSLDRINASFDTAIETLDQ